MPPRYAYWTIIAGGLPTAFRTAERDELLPTFRRIKEKQPDAEMKYFARGKLWTSQEEARLAAQVQREGRLARPARGRDWRPGGDHRDPRQKFKDAKKARNLKWRKERFERRQADPAPPAERPRRGAGGPRRPATQRPATQRPAAQRRSGPPKRRS